MLSCILLITRSAINFARSLARSCASVISSSTALKYLPIMLGLASLLTFKTGLVIFFLVSGVYCCTAICSAILNRLVVVFLPSVTIDKNRCISLASVFSIRDGSLTASMNFFMSMILIYFILFLVSYMLPHSFKPCTGHFLPLAV